MRRLNRLPILVVIASSIVLWSCEPDAPMIRQLQMPAAAMPGLEAPQTRALVDTEATGDDADASIREAMRASGIKASAQYRYAFDGPPAVTFRVKIDYFDSNDVAREQFRGRHLPAALAMTEALDIADDAFIFHQQYSGFVSGSVVVEIRAKPESPALESFTRSYAMHVMKTSQ